MINFFIYMLLLSEVVLFCRIDRDIFGTWITPFLMLSVPYILIITMLINIGPALDLNPLHYESIIIWIVGLAVFWVSGSVPTYLLFRDKVRKNINQPLYLEYSLRTVIIILSWASILASIYGLSKALSGSMLSVLATQEFGDVYGSGWYAHARLCSYAFLMYFVGTSTRKDTFANITAFSIFLCNFFCCF